MGEYRKKPIVIAAVKLTWQTWNEVCAFVGKPMWDKGFVGGVKTEAGDYFWGADSNEHVSDKAKIAAKIPTLEGDMIADEGDFIIRGVQGEFYPCKPDIFEATYDPAS